MDSIDLWIIGCYLLATLVLGVWLGRGQKNQADFFLGGRDLPWVALLLSIVATETSTVTFLSVPGLSFQEGGNFYFLQLAIGYIIGRLAVVVILLPMHFSGRPLTAYAILEHRFGTATRQAGSIVFLLARTAGDGLRLLLTALALHHAVGWPIEGCVVAIAGVAGIYSLWGGVKSVVWNDCLQFGIYTLGAFVILAVILGRLPRGFSQLTDFAVQTGRDHFLDFTLPFTGHVDHITFWSGLFGGAFLSLATHGADHLIVQRYLCAKNQKAAALALATSGPVVFLQFALFLLIGLGVACYFNEFDPSRLTTPKDQALASFVVTELSPGVRGLIMAAVFAAAMSTLSSSVNSSASSLMDDLIAPWVRHWSEEKVMLMARILTAVFTVAQAVVAIAVYWTYNDSAIITQVLAIAGFAAGLLLGLYFLGMAVGRAKNWQAISALIVGAAVTSYALACEVNGLWFPVIGAGTTMMTGILLTLMFPSNEPESNANA
ncbi:sodium/solute symporter [Aeoliella sp. ICT_H6.2]|uniref:Sodium/solute symporter n=1 Tax=Aeoliella straminimaris TaxID=2954799 RepID=A0A9X2JHM9_9BACT|nr:sodium/solute symporter [Aeoliella straminimaris]MCO6044803.1 sodium/solute symporter [Aeoliella straminimaris]